MVFEIKRENGLIFAVDTVDIKEIGEHETGGAYIVFYDGSVLLLDQGYETVKNFFKFCTTVSDFDFISSDFTLMSKHKYKQLKSRQKVQKVQTNIG